MSHNNLPKHYTRRHFLGQAVTVSLAAVWLTACNGNQDNATATAVCEGEEALSVADRTTRQAVNYVDQAPDANKTCANCRFFQQPAVTLVCGGCEVVKGPIAPGGYCTTWVAQEAA